MEKLTIWKQRWAALEAMMKALQVRLASEELAPYVRRPETLQSLLTGLQNFAQCQFAFLYDGFFDKKFFNLEPFSQNKYSADYALRVTLNQIAHDVDLIQRLTEQGTIARLKGNEQSKLLETLDKADCLAYAALKPMLRPSEQPLTVLTYFQKSINIRIIPYAPVVLIGIPITCRETARDFLAIPHEVGHYLYWYHVVTKQEGAQAQIIKKFLDPKPKRFPKPAQNKRGQVYENEPWQAWREEIFADIYGCLIGGPVMALSNQALQDQQPADLFFPTAQSDRMYPFPVARPYIYTQVLKKIDMVQTGEQLDKHWHAILCNEWGVQVGEQGELSHPRLTGFDMPGFLTFVDAMIDRVLPSIAPLSGANQESKRWSDKLPKVDDPAEFLFKQFEDSIAVLDDSAWPAPGEPTMKPEPDYQPIWVDFLCSRGYQVGKDIKAAKNLPKNWAELILADAPANSVTPLPFPGRTWEAVVDLDGWTTEGPGSPRATGG